MTLDGSQPHPGNYGNIANALGAVKAQQQQLKAPEMKLARPYKPQTIGLQQAQACSTRAGFTGCCAMQG